MVSYRDLGMAVLLLVVTWAAYLPALRGEFIWNDSDYVTAPELRSTAGLGTIWFKPGVTEQYYPLLHSFFWVQHKLWGDQPLGYGQHWEALRNVQANHGDVLLTTELLEMLAAAPDRVGAAV